MEIKLVDRPYQGPETNPENVQYPGESWCVITDRIRETEGGVSAWFKKMKDLNPDVLYLYNIQALHQGIVQNSNGDVVEEIVYYIRAKAKNID